LPFFPEFKVLEESILADSTVVEGNSANQVGPFRQRVTVPNGQTVEVAGRFKAEWVRGSSPRWLIWRMETTPTP
jgi:hypothetical protein